MTGLDYKTVKACYDAQQLLSKHRNISPVKTGDRTYETSYGYGNKVVYSQQEFIILPSQLYKDYDVGWLLNMYPSGVGRTYYRNPWKEYVHFQDAAGTLRYYLVPEKGLRLQRDGEGYMAMNAVPDYHVEVDRTKAKEARKPAEDLYNYINLLWDMLPDMSYNDRPGQVIHTLPKVDDRDGWHEYVVAAKFAHYGRLAKSTVLQKIRSEYTEKALAFNITQVPNTRTDHTEHWDKLYQLREAGLLEQYEGKVKKKRKANVKVFKQKAAA